MFFFDFSDFFYKITYFLSSRSQSGRRSGFKCPKKLSAEESGGENARKTDKGCKKIGGVKAHWERGLQDDKGGQGKGTESEEPI